MNSRSALALALAISLLAATGNAVAQPGPASLDAEVHTFGVSNVLVVPASFDEARAYLIVKAMFENKGDLASAHAEARNLSLESAVSGSPVAFSAGALKYYREKGVEPQDGPAPTAPKP